MEYEADGGATVASVAEPTIVRISSGLAITCLVSSSGSGMPWDADFIEENRLVASESARSRFKSRLSSEYTVLIKQEERLQI